MPYLRLAPGPREHPTPRDARGTHSSGQSFEQLRRECLQRGALFEDPDFPATSASLFYSERPQIPFVWKRPGVSAAGRPGGGGAARRGGAGACAHPCPAHPLWLLGRQGEGRSCHRMTQGSGVPDA